jgi:2-polyprenyl-3-methyl-5-hydroxy-6-metoxy-1,4-benzoquinol methylase
MDNDTSSSYWNERFRLYGESRGTYKAICSYGMPYLYNKYIDIIQKRAFTASLDALALKERSVLDIGCGTGRWCRIIAEKGAHVTRYRHLGTGNYTGATNNKG